MFEVGAGGLTRVPDSKGLGRGCSLLPHPSQGLKEAKTLGPGQGAGPVPRSAETDQRPGRRANPYLVHLGTEGLPGRGCPGAKFPAVGGALGFALLTGGLGSGSAFSLEGGMIPGPLWISLLIHFTPPLRCGPSSSRRPNHPRRANGAARIPIPPQALALPGSGPGVQQMLLIRGLHAAPRVPLWVGKPRVVAPRSEPWKLGARRSRQGSVSPSGKALRPSPVAPRAPLARQLRRAAAAAPARAALGLRWDSPAVALLQPGLRAPSALSGSCHPVRSGLPGVVCKSPRGRGREWPAAKDARELFRSIHPLCP